MKQSFQIIAPVVIAATLLASPAHSKPLIRGAIAKGVVHLVHQIGNHPEKAAAVVFVAAATAACAGGCTVVVGPIAAP